MSPLDIATLVYDYGNPWNEPSIKGNIVAVKNDGWIDHSVNEPLNYCVYLPPNYDASSSYPILYHLHGLQSPFAWMVRDVKWTAQQLEAVGIDIIIAAPLDPTGSSMWLNGNKIRMMDRVLKEFIPLVLEKQYKVSHRYLQGFSMGGFGAARYAFTGMFEKVIVWDGALHDWETLQAKRPDIVRGQFGKHDESTFDSPLRIAAKDVPPMLLFSGVGFGFFLDRQATKFKTKLDRLGVSNVSHTKTEFRHSLKRMLRVHGKEAVQFLMTVPSDE